MRRILCLIPLTLLAVSVAPSMAQTTPDRVAFGLDWKAEAEYGGYYQAVATGLYARHGMEVTIRQGGPQVNQAQLLLAGRLDFNIASNGYLALNLAQEALPFTAVAAMFQRDPAVLPGASRPRQRQLRGAARQAHHDRRRHAGGLVELPARPTRLHRHPNTALHLQPRAVPGGSAGGAAGLSGVGAVCNP